MFAYVVNKWEKPKARKSNIRNIQEIKKSTMSIVSAGQPHMACILFSKLVPYMTAASLKKKIPLHEVLLNTVY